MCVCMRERQSSGACIWACVCVCKHICRAPLWTMRPGTQSGPCLLAWGGKQGTGQAGPTGDVMGMSWGSGHTDHRDLGLWASYGPQKHGRDWLDLRAAEGAVTPWDTPSLLASAGTALCGFTLPRNKVVWLSGGLDESSQ